ncbi:hypothetical protein MMC13_004690 [Lambiella insularis]|nr:hypothetical protein [Lambiella insularis]
MALDNELGLEDLYQVDSDGLISGGKITRSPNSINFLNSDGIQCPQCLKPIHDVHRYEAFNRLKALPSTIDYLYAKIGRSLSFAVRDIFNTEEYLDRTFKTLCTSLKSGPLAGKHNQRVVWARGNQMLEAQQKATTFRDEIVVPFEANITRLASYLDNASVLVQMVSPMKLRFDQVYYCCRLVTLEDALKVYRHLLTLEPADQHTSIIAEGLRLKILEQSCGEVKSLEARIMDCKKAHLKRLETELRIIQLSLHMILKSLGVVSGLNVAASLSAMRELCLTFPDTAGKMLGTYQRLRAYAEGGPAPERFLEMYTRDAVALAPLFAKYEMGQLTFCAHRHPYCGATFVDCPECGREVAMPVHVDNTKFLREGDFMAGYAASLSTLAGRYGRRR